MDTTRFCTRLCIYGNLALAVALAFWFGFYPAVRVAADLRDPNLAGPGAPAAAFRLHRSLAPKLER